jgi:hypothetical protein
MCHMTFYALYIAAITLSSFALSLTNLKDDAFVYHISSIVICCFRIRFPSTAASSAVSPTGRTTSRFRSLSTRSPFCSK